MTFLERIFERLQQAATAPVLCEIRDGKLTSVTGSEFLAMVQQARNFLLARGVKKGDRCARGRFFGYRMFSIMLMSDS